jgi:large subunit ribosomal protein L35
MVRTNPQVTNNGHSPVVVCLPVVNASDEYLLEQEAIMPKLKTHKGTAKRFRLTKNGKVMRMKPGRSHLRRNKSASLNSDFRHAVSSTEKSIVKKVKVLVGKAGSK